jgi:hypothetical protein
MSRSIYFVGFATLLISPAISQAQSAAPTTALAPDAQAAPAALAPSAQATPDTQAAPAGLATAPAGEVATAAPATAAAAGGVTKEGEKYMKDGRKATKTEVAEFKKAEKAKHE